MLSLAAKSAAVEAHRAMRLHFRSLDGETWEADLGDEVVHETAGRWAKKKGPKVRDANGDMLIGSYTHGLHYLCL